MLIHLMKAKKKPGSQEKKKRKNCDKYNIEIAKISPNLMVFSIQLSLTHKLKTQILDHIIKGKPAIFCPGRD